MWTIDPSDKQFIQTPPENVPRLREVERDFWRLSAQNPTHPSFSMHASMTAELARRTTSPISKKPKRRVVIARTTEEEEAASLASNYGEIDTEEKLDLAITHIMGRLAYNEQYIKETHEYTMILPSKFYDAGSHDMNRRVAFALKHTDEERLFLTWIKLRSKAADFDYGEIPARYNEWTKNMNRNDGDRAITRNSILFWARTENPDEYSRIKLGGVDHYIDLVIASSTDHAFALMAHQMRRDTYICSDYKNRTWYRYVNHRWCIDRGATLRKFLSTEMHAIFVERCKLANAELRIEQANASENNADKIKLMTGAVKNLHHILDKLYTSGPKDAIMRECVEVFYDPLFTARMDADPRLLGFTNGVVDFHTNVFRPGQPQDYITMSTNVEYTATTLSPSPLYIDEVTDFMCKLFPDPDLRRYVWQYLASTLIGTRMNQTLHFMIGSGANGKSALMDALGFALGDYKRGVPANLLCGKRVATGGVSPEVIILKGCRLGIIQEPSRTEVIQDGLLKELSTEKYLQGRGLYCDPETFLAQFSLGICLNTLLEMPSNDDGTWRRIRVVLFESKFVGVGENHTTESKYMYEKDPDMEQKIERWGATLGSMLVDLAFQTHGKLERCEKVEAASKSYRESQDILAAFINERVAVDTTSSPPASIKQGQLLREFTDWCKECRRGSRTPKPQELYEVMNKRFGEPKNGFWMGLRIITNNDVAADVPVAMPVEKSPGF
jgi:P4 family phage/plasmid primase-like protien